MEEEKEVSKKHNGWKIAFIILLILIVVGTGGYFAYKYFWENKDAPIKEEVIDDNKEEENEEELSYTDTSEYKYSLNIYKDSKGKYCYKQSSDCKTIAFSIPTEGEDTKIYHLYTNYVIYKDNGIKVYEILNNRLLLTDIKDGYDDYSLYIDEDEENLYGIILTKNDINSYWNYKTRELIYEDINGEIAPINDKYIVFRYFDEDYTVSLGLAKEKKILLKDECAYFTVNPVGEHDFITMSTGCTISGDYTVYTDELKEIFKVKEEDGLGFTDKTLLVNDNNIVKEYDVTGKLINSKEYRKVIDVSDKGYIVYLDNDNYLCIGEFNGSFSKQLIKWDNNYYYHFMISGYYDKNRLNNENEKEAGIYLILQTDKNIDEGPGIEYYINVDTHEFREYQLEMIGGYAKPVLYLYPTKDTNITVNFSNEELLTTTYPKFNDSWEVLAKPNGDLYDKDNHYYYGLYWEEKLNHLVSFDEGFYVEDSDAIKFLEDKLSYIGLNDREANEAIMYWLPILEKNKKSLVYFELTEERDRYNKLEITPKPDSILRVAIHVKKVDKKTSIKEEKLIPFKRFGFSAIEWGGINY